MDLSNWLLLKLKFWSIKRRTRKIYQNKDDESHQLIEEFMLLANQTIARIARKKRLPVVYRTHPDLIRKVYELRNFLSLFGISCGELTSRKEVQKMLIQINRSHLASPAN